MSCWATLFRAEQSRAEQSRAEQSYATYCGTALRCFALGGAKNINRITIPLFPCVVVVVSVLQHLLKLYTGDIDQVKELQYSFA
jgi:hypothetical protein